jgi:hypothetical protein
MEKIHVYSLFVSRDLRCGGCRMRWRIFVYHITISYPITVSHAVAESGAFAVRADGKHSEWCDLAI